MTDVVEIASRRDSRRWAGVRLSRFDRPSFADAVIHTMAGSGVASGDETGVTRRPLLVTFLNPFYARATAREPALAGIVDQFDIVQPDGWGVVYGARLAGIRVPSRVAIEDVERSVFAALAARAGSVYLFGSAPGIVEQAAVTLTRSFPGLQVAGTQHGWLDVEAGHPGILSTPDAERVANDVRASGADLVMVGLPTPLQQQWAATYGPSLQVPVVMTVGAYFDKLAEGLDWYPRWMERARLGWAYRVYREPRRLIGRYTVGMISFVRLVLTEALTARTGRKK